MVTETSKYLSILAKVMRNKYLPEEGQRRDNYDRLYYLIHTELNESLQKSMYPYTSDIIQRTDEMLDAIEPLYICNEIVGKKCLWISSHITTNIFDICDIYMENKEFVCTFRKVYTQIPIVIVDSADTDSIEVINYANIRIKLSATEFKFLVNESNKRKIALNKVIQFVVVHTKMNDSSLCIISDNIYAHAEKLFSRALSGRLVYIDDEGISHIEKRRIPMFTSLLLNEKNYIDTSNNPKMNKYNRVCFNEIEGFVRSYVHPVIYGFWEEYASIEMQIMEFYESQLEQSESILKEVKGDIVRIGDRKDSMLTSIRTFEEGRTKKLKSEKNSLKNILQNIDELVLQICTELGENYITEKKISKDVFDNMFSAMFSCKSFTSGMGKKIISKLYSYEYDNYDLVTAYVQSSKGKNLKYDVIEIGKIEWEKAKMLLSILNPDNITEDKLKRYVNALGKHCSTGKELYAKALTEPKRKSQYTFQESLRKGYLAAGDRLMDMYKEGLEGINLKTLANSLIPEACMVLAEESRSRYQGHKRFVDLSDHEFTYYKIAAANQYIPAIGKIVDIVFESWFSSGFQISADDLRNKKYQKMIENGHVACILCHYLISKMYNQAYYSEILGIILFSLNEDLSGAMSLLSNSKSALGLYCKGYMYEFGSGVAIDVDEAIKNYKKSIKLKASQMAEKRLEICQNKKARYEEDKNDGKYYQENRSYRSTTTYVGSTTDDGCFAPGTKILMEDGTYCEVENIKIDDIVMIFNHYTGELCCERIVANVHECMSEKKFDIINLFFEDDMTLSIVKSHALFDANIKRYVWIKKENVGDYVGHAFACYNEGKISFKYLKGYEIVRDNTKYYMPISRFHLNVFAENFLTIPPTKMTVNMFECKDDMVYDTDIVNRCGLTRYDDIKSLISQDEYEELPCKYLKAICELKKLSVDDFMEAIHLYRQQEKYRRE